MRQVLDLTVSLGAASRLDAVVNQGKYGVIARPLRAVLISAERKETRRLNSDAVLVAQEEETRLVGEGGVRTETLFEGATHRCARPRVGVIGCASATQPRRAAGFGGHAVDPVDQLRALRCLRGDGRAGEVHGGGEKGGGGEGGGGGREAGEGRRERPSEE